MLYVYSFEWNFDDGCLSGLFVCEETAKAKLENLIASKKSVYFGEVLGKHSYVSGVIEEGDITRFNAHQEDIMAMLRVLGLHGVEDYYTICGYNPLDYVE